jgi:hypothetical protein
VGFGANLTKDTSRPGAKHNFVHQGEPLVNSQEGRINPVYKVGKTGRRAPAEMEVTKLMMRRADSYPMEGEVL